MGQFPSLTVAIDFFLLACPLLHLPSLPSFFFPFPSRYPAICASVQAVQLELLPCAEWTLCRSLVPRRDGMHDIFSQSHPLSFHSL